MPKLEDIHLAKSALDDNVFIGTKSKQQENTWNQKKDITNEFLQAAIARWNGYEEVITSNKTNTQYKIAITDDLDKNKKRDAKSHIFDMLAELTEKHEWLKIELNTENKGIKQIEVWTYDYVLIDIKETSWDKLVYELEVQLTEIQL